MAFGLNFIAINGICSAQSHRQGIKHAKSTQDTQSVKRIKNTQSTKHTHKASKDESAFF